MSCKKYQLASAGWVVVTYLAFPFFVTFFLAFFSALAVVPSVSLLLSKRVFLAFTASAADVARLRLLGAIDRGGELRWLFFVLLERGGMVVAVAEL